MKLVMRRPTELYPAGQGFSFIEPKTKKEFNGLHGSPNETARKVVEHRRANPHIFSEASEFDVESVVQEIFAQKFATMPELFIGFGDPTETGMSNKCKCGANDWEEIYCPTCAGKRVVGHKCRKCGKEK